MIDLAAATRDELLAYAKDVKKLEFPKNIKTEALRAKLDGTAIGSVSLPKNEVDKAAVKMVKIIIQETDEDAGGDDVFVSVNGEINGKRINKRYQIQRGEEVEVPEYVVENLRNAIKTVYRTKIDRATGQSELVSRDVLSYPFQIVT